jgi:hypothetical protein
MALFGYNCLNILFALSSSEKVVSETGLRNQNTPNALKTAFRHSSQRI